jgi:SHO1 osmosensor
VRINRFFDNTDQPSDILSVSHAPVRILWFGFVIQTILTVLVFLVILGSASYNAAYAYGTQISIFAALATAFAVLGVDQNIYSHHSAQQATGAGWLVVAIVDLTWIIFFTSPPQSPVFSIADSLGASEARDQEGHQNKVQKIFRSTDAFALSPLHGGGVGSTRGDVRASRASAPPQLPDPQNPRLTGGHWGLYTSPQKSGGRGTITSITSEPKTPTASGRVRSGADLESHAGSVRPESGGAGPDELVGAEAKMSSGSASEKAAPWKAEALFTCKLLSLC